MAYLDNAGLYRKYGTEKTVANKTGEYKTFGPNRMVEIKGLDLTTLTTTDAIIADVSFYQKNYIVDNVEIWTRTAATTGTAATLHVGSIDTDRSSNALENAILNAVAVTDMDADGEKVTKNGPPASGGLGVYADKDTVPTSVKYITAGTGVGTFTAGVVDIRIHLRPLV